MNGKQRSTARRAPMFCALALTATAAWAQDPAITPAVTIDQSQIKTIPLAKILESGGDFHTTPFTPWNAVTGVGDGHGEGPDGPRSQQRKALYPQAFPNFPFLRLNGIDSQSCYECHNTIGSYTPPDYSQGSQALLRKPSPVGGSAGVASTAFINPAFPNPLTQLVRNPPHVFGTGYAQSIAFEMSTQLNAQVQSANDIAMARAGAGGIHHQPGKQTVSLTAKGLSFGTYSVECVSNTQIFCTYDTSKVTGVSTDFIVRPFQWKGIASSVRHFVRDAMDFHFSMQAVEKVGHIDCDKDGKIDEMTLGNVTALTAFVAMTRPPQVVVPAGGQASFDRGKAIFEGTAPDIKNKLYGQMCATCHVPSLSLTVPTLTIEDPGVAPVTDMSGCPTETTLINAVPAARHSITQQVKARVKAILAKRGAATKAAVEGDDKAANASIKDLQSDAVLAATPPEAPNDTSLQIDLTNPGQVPAFAFPRLTANADKSVTVPLLSDLRTHNMGKGLADSVSQGVDVEGVPPVPPPLFLTRPLWGVADTGPWLHDGRARTLAEAIAFHMSDGSEANPVITAFNILSASDQQAVVNFLLAQRLPIAQDITVGGGGSQSYKK